MIKNSFFLVLIMSITSSLSGVSTCWFCNNTSDTIQFKNIYDEKLQAQKIPGNLASGNIVLLTNLEFVIFAIAGGTKEYIERLDHQAYYLTVSKAKDGVVTTIQKNRYQVKLLESIYPAPRTAKSNPVKKAIQQKKGRLGSLQSSLLAFQDTN